ncbi:hypothetical protein [Vibrio mimicus]|uniref:hypothetical protein n=1 Tax=Vibrio mimicus TaxID=674 RepID=UPI001E28C071|nr:hypothetical protein [Vibrio mimicus]
MVTPHDDDGGIIMVFGKMIHVVGRDAQCGALCPWHVSFMKIQIFADAIRRQNKPVLWLKGALKLTQSGDHLPTTPGWA